MHRKTARGAVLGPLVCDLTEAALAADKIAADAFAHEIRELGCRIPLDDCNIGYGRFADLKCLPVTVLEAEILEQHGVECAQRFTVGHPVPIKSLVEGGAS